MEIPQIWISISGAYKPNFLQQRQPPIAQLVERETVDPMQNQISLGRWFKSGSVDYF